MWDELTGVEKALPLIPKLSPVQLRARLYSQGDYWHDGAAWVGTPFPDDAADSRVVKAEIESGFIPQPLIEEVAERHVNGLVGHEMPWSFVLQREVTEDAPITPDEEKFLSEINSAVGDVWDRHNDHEKVHQWTTMLIYLGRAVMRNIVPRGLLDETGAIPQAARTWDRVLERIHMMPVEPECGTVALDLLTMEKASVLSFQENRKKSPSFNDGVRKYLAGEDEKVQRIEISYLDAQGKTVIRILEEDVIVEDGEQTQDTGGELYLYEATRKPLITDAVQRNQYALNHVHSMTSRNANLAGSRERNLFNVQRPTMEVEDPNSPTGKRNVPVPIEIGAGSVNTWTGIVYEDVDGNKKIAGGSMVITDPVSPEPLVKAADQFRQNILRATSQMHEEISGDATASAISRIIARAGFIESLLKSKPLVEGMLRSRLWFRVMLACHLSGDAARAKRIKDELRVRVDLRLNSGPLTPEERQAVVTLYENGLIARESAQTMLGVEDVEAEANKLREEGDGKALTLKDKAEIFALLSGNGNAYGAALVAGFDDDEAKTLAQEFLPSATDSSAAVASSPQKTEG